MSYKVAVLAEDHTYDQYIVKPVVQALLAHLGKPNAQVFMITTPRIQGHSQMKQRACEILSRWSPIVDVLLLAIDLDCQDGLGGRSNRRVSFLDVLANCPVGSDKGVVVLAVNEIEVWALWGCRGELADSWEAIRAHCNPKEVYFAALLTQADRLRP